MTSARAGAGGSVGGSVEKLSGGGLIGLVVASTGSLVVNSRLPRSYGVIAKTRGSAVSGLPVADQLTAAV